MEIFLPLSGWLERMVRPYNGVVLVPPVRRFKVQAKLPGDHRAFMKVGVNRKGRNARNEDDAFTDGKSRTG